MSLLDALKKFTEEQYGGPLPKPIEDQVAECVWAVMLDVECSPVIEKPGSEETTEVTRHEDGTYSLTYRNVCVLDAVAYEPVSEADLKVMRARYLVTRGAKHKRLHAMNGEERKHALRTFFPQGVHVPREGSQLALAMGMEDHTGRLDKGPR